LDRNLCKYHFTDRYKQGRLRELHDLQTDLTEKFRKLFED
jgi:hypothetical protein